MCHGGNCHNHPEVEEPKKSKVDTGRVMRLIHHPRPGEGTEGKVTQSYPTLGDPKDCRVHGILSGQEYRSGWPFPSPGDLFIPEIEPRSPALLADSLPAERQGKRQRGCQMPSLQCMAPYKSSLCRHHHLELPFTACGLAARYRGKCFPGIISFNSKAIFFHLFFIIIGVGGVALSVFCCEQAFSSCSEQGLRFVGVLRFKSTDSAVEVHSLSSSAASGSFLVQPGIEPVSPALSGRFLTTGPPGKPLKQS